MHYIVFPQNLLSFFVLLEFHYIQWSNFNKISSCAKVEGGNACLGCQHEVFLWFTRCFHSPLETEVVQWSIYIYISNPTKTALLYSSFMMLNVYTNHLTTTIDLQIFDTVNLGSLMTPVVGSRITRSVISEFPTSRHLTLLNAKKPPDAPKKQHAQTVTGFIPNILQPLKLNWQHEKPQRNDFPNFPNSVLIPCGWTPFRMDIMYIDVWHEKSA